MLGYFVVDSCLVALHGIETQNIFGELCEQQAHWHLRRDGESSHSLLPPLAPPRTLSVSHVLRIRRVWQRINHAHTHRGTRINR